MRAAGSRIQAFFLAAAAVALGAGTALANDALVDARFVDHCLDRPVEAEPLYRKALETPPKLTPRERAEAEFAIARACSLDGRAEAASTTLEKLADLSGDASAGPWPARAREALDRLATGESAFLPEVRGRGQLSLEATAKPLFNVLRDLAGRTSVSFALDASCPEAWTVSVALGDLSLEELLDKLVGQGRWRRVGDGVAIGDCAANGPAWERPWSWGQVEDRAGRALGARLCTTRVSLNFPAIKLSEALAKINVLGVCEVSAAPGQGDRVVRVIAKDLRLDQALDLLAAPLGLAWTIAGDKVSIGPRKEKGE